MLVIQIGFNWKGDIRFPLFENGTKGEMINYLKSNISKKWEISKIGIAEQIENKIEYKSLSNNNIVRNDRLGEFLNRPLFVLKK
ncbi:MAG: hypothetical protein KDC52_14120 [Ignavibacteriae bacterium]|nr:hypothetical protein [Ignavibacteriota bacterium]